MHIAAVQHRQTRIAQTNAESEKVDRVIQEAAKEADVLMALTKFSQAWDGIGRAQTDELQRAYIEQNPYPAGQRSSLLKAAGSLLYHNVHEQFHPMLREMKVRLRLYDSYLLDIRGNVVYSVEKELDFAVNVGSGSLKASALGRAFAASMRIPQEKQVIDYEPYEPKNFALAKFVSQAISSRGGQVVGVLCFQLGSERTLEEIKLEFNEAGKYVQSATDMLWLAHNNLAFVYKATLPEIKVQSHIRTLCAPFSVC
jgi:methyl-accepting chemotaxis protein